MADVVVFRLTVIKTEYLPFMDITWITESSFVAAVGVALWRD